MGYLFLVLMVITGSIKGYCGRKTSGEISSLDDSLLISSTRLFLCMVIAFFIPLIYVGGFSFLGVEKKFILICLFSGLSMATFVLSWLFAIKTSACIFVEVFLTLGFIIPIIACSLFFNESIKFTQIIGLGLLVIASVILSAYNSSLKGKLKISSLILLIVCGLSNGFNLFASKWFSNSFPSATIGNTYTYNFYLYLFAFVTTALFLLFYKLIKKTKRPDANDGGKKVKQLFTVKVCIYIFIMSVCLFLNSFFSVLTANRLSAIQMYPLSQGLNMFLSLVTSAIFFGDKIKPLSIIGTIVAFGALLIINLL